MWHSWIRATVWVGTQTQRSAASFSAPNRLSNELPATIGWAPVMVPPVAVPVGCSASGARRPEVEVSRWTAAHGDEQLSGILEALGGGADIADQGLLVEPLGIEDLDQLALAGGEARAGEVDRGLRRFEGEAKAASKPRLATMLATVSTVGTRRVKPAVYFRPTAQPISDSPARVRNSKA